MIVYFSNYKITDNYNEKYQQELSVRQQTRLFDHLTLLFVEVPDRTSIAHCMQKNDLFG